MSNSDPDFLSDDDEIIEVAEVHEAEEVYEAEEVTGEEELEHDEEDEGGQRRRFIFFQAAPAWLVSTMIHIAILLILGLLTIANPIKIVNVLTASSTAEDGPEMEEFTIDDSEPSEMEESAEDVSEPVEITEPVEMVEPTEVQMEVDIASVQMDVADFASDMAPASMSLASLSSAQAKPMGSRSTDMKKKLLKEYGGTPSSEAAVQEALKWLARHQLSNGAWTLQHNRVCKNACGDPCDEKRAKQINAATALALLPFLGAGQTHMEGEFKKVVHRGLLFMAQNGKPGNVNGLPVIDYRGEGGNMYDHGLVSIVLCEAYAMTGDSALAGPAQASLNFIVTAQCSDGGWRYSPREARGGDTSVVGWQVMALKSGYMGHLSVPPSSIQGSMLYLDKVQSDGGSIYGYDKPSARVRSGTTAVGLLCRMYMGWDKEHPGIVKGVNHLERLGVSKNDLYYNYYAAQVLRQYGGPKWDKFNVELRDFLVDAQSQKGGAKGSWFLEKGGHFNSAGRLCATSFATMILEVYYRHMPLYADAASEDDFPL